jgi:hypothetical protein
MPSTSTFQAGLARPPMMSACRFLDRTGLAVSRRTSFAHCCQPLESGTAIEPISVADRTGKSAEI